MRSSRSKRTHEGATAGGSGGGGGGGGGRGEARSRARRRSAAAAAGGGGGGGDEAETSASLGAAAAALVRAGDDAEAMATFQCAMVAPGPGTVVAATELARLLREHADGDTAIGQAEELLRAAMEAAASATDEEDQQAGVRAAERLALLLCQEGGRDAEAAGIMTRTLGCRYRLARGVLAYELPRRGEKAPAAPPGAPPADKYVMAFDRALPAAMFEHLSGVFAPGAAFWTEHGYIHTEASDYFSYVHDIGAPAANSMDEAIAHVHSVICAHIPAAAGATRAEWWAHARPHSSGHQLHYDSDKEGRDGVRHPLATCVLYLSRAAGVVGGPTLVTTQTLSSTALADAGWLAYPGHNRMCVLDSNVLHGVIPGRGVTPARGALRVTLMIAYWKDIVLRPAPAGGATGGAAQRFPSRDDARYTWQKDMAPRAWGRCTPVRVPPVPVPVVWEDVDFERNTRDGVALCALKALPHYSTCFQGF
jgi:hypothetical protein